MLQIDKLQSTISPDTCFNIQFTSGTTARAKAARMSHFSLVNCGYHMGSFFFQFYAPLNCLQFYIFFVCIFAGKRLEFDKNYARICVNNPLFHAYGTAISIMVALNHGAALILPAPHFTPELSLRAIVEEKANVVYGTPTSKLFHDFVCDKK